MPKKDPYTRDSDSRFTLRIPEGLLEEIKKHADKNKRSAGKQIEFILEEWMNEHYPGWSGEDDPKE